LEETSYEKNPYQQKKDHSHCLYRRFAGGGSLHSEGGQGAQPQEIRFHLKIIK
jgi:hypothetical protein